MALMETTQESAISFQLEGGDADQFQVLRYRGTEGLCQLYRFEIELSCIDETLDFDSVVGMAACLTITIETGRRSFHGIISRFELTGQGDQQTYFRAELVPEVWLLTHRYHSRIFQQKSTKDIITQVLSDAGIGSDRFDLAGLTAEYAPRDYCVQYRETDYNFIARLMEEEGIRWFFRQEEEGHTLVLADSADYAPIDGEAELPFHPQTGMQTDAEHVSHFRKGQCVRPGAVKLTDYSFENPTLDLGTESDCGRDTGLEFSDYPGQYKEQSPGQTVAQRRAEEFESQRVMGVGRTDCLRLTTGATFDLIEHPAQPLNGTYMITSITHEGKQPVGQASTGSEIGRGVLDARTRQSLVAARNDENPAIRELAAGLLQVATRLQAGDPTAHRALTHWLYHAGQVSKDLSTISIVSGGGPLEGLSIPSLIDDITRAASIDSESPLYICRFECMPGDVTYRPPRATPWPEIRGVQTARVVGPSGEEIYTDEYGRVRVQFNWDREGAFGENASCWIRVSQGMAGGGYGMMFLPRVGQEVIVDFVEGNPDQPIITGRVFNADQMPPYPLPDEKTKSVIKTHTSKGGAGTNEIRFEDLAGSEQLLINGQADFHIRVGNEERHNVKMKQHLIVEDEQREKVSGNRSIKLEADDAVDVGGSQSLTVGSDSLNKVGGNLKFDVSSECFVKATKIIMEADAGISLKCGGSFVLIDSSGVSVSGPMVKLNSGGSALSSSVTDSPAAPAEPEEADSVTAGSDVSYTGEVIPPPPIEQTPPEANWIGIRLKDDEGNPMPGEYFEITLPSGKVIFGTLDVNGYRRMWLPEGGNCEVAFPNLDPDEWEAK